MNNELKILHIIDSLGLGGAQTVVKGIFEYQPENKSIFLFVLRQRDITTEIKHSNVRIFNSTKKYSFKPLFELRDLVRKENIDILHCHLLRSQVFGWLLKKIYFKNIKLIFHEHGQIVGSESDNIFESIIFIMFIKISKNNVNKFIAISNFIKDKLVEKGNINETKIIVVYNFVDLNKFNKKNIIWNIKKEREKLRIHDNDYVVGFAGRLIKRKGWREFINSAKILLQENKNIKFIIAGDGVEKSKLTNFIYKNKLNKDVIYFGYVENMIWFYSLINCLVIPSHWEPMGLIEIEAQAMGIPVMASNVSGLNEIIEHNKNGILFDVKNLIDLSREIKFLKSNSKLSDTIIRNSQNTVKNFSLDHYIKNIKGIYE